MSACDAFGIMDRDEVIYKIRLLIGYLSELEEEKEDGIRKTPGTT